MEMVGYHVAPGVFVFGSLLAAVFMLLPFIVLYLVAESWAQSKWHVLWGFLNWTGVIAGIIVMAILRGQDRPGAGAHPTGYGGS